MPVFRNFSFPAACLSLLLFCFSGTAMAQSYWAGVAENIVKQLQQAQALAEKNDISGAKQSLAQAYYWEFEGSKMEAAMRTQMGAKPTYQLEKKFGEMRKALQDPEQASAIAAELIQGLRDSARILDEAEVPESVFKVNQ